MSVAKLARVLDQGARDTCSRILRDHRNDLEPHEETLTQNFVSGYVSRTRAAKLRSTTKEFTRWEEARHYGADVALWFTNTRGEFAGVYLQSKVLRRDGAYRGLDHTNSHGRQYDTLVSAGARDGALAGYAFYNGLRGAEPDRSACGHGVGSPEINGISVASALLLSAHIRSKVQRIEIEGMCSPLSCLVRLSGSSAYLAAGAGNPVNVSPSGTGNGGDSVRSTDPDLPRALLGLATAWQQDGARLHTSESVPPYVRALAERAHNVAAYSEVNASDDYFEGQDHLQRLTEESRFSEGIDESRYFTAVLVGP